MKKRYTLITSALVTTIFFLPLLIKTHQKKEKDIRQLQNAMKYITNRNAMLWVRDSAMLQEIYLVSGLFSPIALFERLSTIKFRKKIKIIKKIQKKYPEILTANQKQALIKAKNLLKLPTQKFINKKNQLSSLNKLTAKLILSKLPASFNKRHGTKKALSILKNYVDLSLSQKNHEHFMQTPLKKRWHEEAPLVALWYSIKTLLYKNEKRKLKKIKKKNQELRNNSPQQTMLNKILNEAYKKANVIIKSYKVEP